MSNSNYKAIVGNLICVNCSTTIQSLRYFTNVLFVQWKGNRSQANDPTTRVCLRDALYLIDCYKQTAQAVLFFTAFFFCTPRPTVQHVASYEYCDHKSNSNRHRHTVQRRFVFTVCIAHTHIHRYKHQSLLLSAQCSMPGAPVQLKTSISSEA